MTFRLALHVVEHGYRRGLPNAQFDHDDKLAFTGVTMGKFQALHAETPRLLWSLQIL
jgi:hypothetical protein